MILKTHVFIMTNCWSELGYVSCAFVGGRYKCFFGVTVNFGSFWRLRHLEPQPWGT